MDVVPDGEFILVLDKVRQCRDLVASAVNRGRGIRRCLSSHVKHVYMEQGSHHHIQIPVEGEDVKRIRARICGTCLVTTAVVKVVVGGDVGDDVDAKVSSGCLELGDIVRVDGGGVLCIVVDEEVGVVIVADGDGDHLHGSESPENNRHAQVPSHSHGRATPLSLARQRP